MIRVDCPACGKSLKVADDFAGKTGKCPACGERLKVPDLKSSATQDIATLVPEKRSIEVRPNPLSDPLPAPAPVQGASSIVAVQVNHLPRASNSLGIASLILGVISFMICWIPFLGLLGLPLSLLGILLGGLAVLVAIFRKGSGIGFPIAGTSLSLLSTVTVIAITSAAANAVNEAGKAARESTAEADATHQAVVPAGVEQQPKANKVASPSPDLPEPSTSIADFGEEWANAANAVQQGDIQVRVTEVSIGRVPLKSSFGDGGESKDELLILRVEVRNTNSTKKVDYNTWSGADASFGRSFATLNDNFGNSYKRIGFGFSSTPVGAVRGSQSIYPNKSLVDVLVFEMPIDTIEYLHLELPASNFGGTGMLRLKIPKEMIAR